MKMKSFFLFSLAVIGSVARGLGKDLEPINAIPIPKFQDPNQTNLSNTCGFDESSCFTNSELCLSNALTAFKDGSEINAAFYLNKSLESFAHSSEDRACIHMALSKLYYDLYTKTTKSQGRYEYNRLSREHDTLAYKFNPPWMSFTHWPIPQLIRRVIDAQELNPNRDFPRLNVW